MAPKNYCASTAAFIYYSQPLHKNNLLLVFILSYILTYMHLLQFCQIIYFMAYFVTFYQNLSFLLGKAEEFKVAAVNKNGPGEFSHITPVHVVKGMLNIQIY